MTPVLKLWARVARCAAVAAGTPVGYGRGYVAPAERALATVLLGFGSGYPRGLANRGVARVRDRLCPVVGAVGLNHLTVDVTGVPGVAPGEAVEMIGTAREAGNSIEALAAAAGVPVDIVCLAGQRLPRVYLRGGRPVGIAGDRSRERPAGSAPEHGRSEP